MDPTVTGIGVATGFGLGKAALMDGLFSGRDIFGRLTRPGRSAPPGRPSFFGVELPELPSPPLGRVGRTAGLSGLAALAVLGEAWHEAGLDDVDPERIGLIVGGSNLQSRAMLLAQEDLAAGRRVVSPHLAYALLDTDLCGLCVSHFGIRAFAHTIGGASASGAVAVLHAAEAVRTGRVEACVALGALQDLSAADLLAFEALGALAETVGEPGAACRPFDCGGRGFVFGESCAALVLRRDGPGYGRITGGAQGIGGQRGPEPSTESERRAISRALQLAGLAPRAIDHVSAHATGTPRGDEAEAAAILGAGLDGAWINASKSLTGHGIAAAGAVGLAALLLQMRAGRLHATRNLEQPIEPRLRFVTGAPVACAVRHALSLSFGFAGIETAIVVSAP